MKLPRDLSGDELAKSLRKLGYSVTRQSGSHLRLSTLEKGEHHATIPAHNPLKVGTLSSILSDIAEHFGITKEELCRRIF
jgi:predicted RNA binding protein YcfA (HicA-like mRNA interferase family)